MKINYFYTTTVWIIFDELFEIKRTESLDSIVNFIDNCMDVYKFYMAEVIDAKTGELLVQVKNE